MDELPGQMFHPKAIRDGHFESHCLAPVLLDLLAGYFGEVIARTITERDVGALAGKHVAQRLADAARATGYERALSFEQQTHSLHSLTRPGPGTAGSLFETV